MPKQKMKQQEEMLARVNAVKSDALFCSICQNLQMGLDPASFNLKPQSVATSLQLLCTVIMALCKILKTVFIFNLL